MESTVTQNSIKKTFTSVRLTICFARACLILSVNFNSDHCVRSKNLIRPENVIFAPPTRLSTIDLKVLLFKVARTS